MKEFSELLEVYKRDRSRDNLGKLYSFIEKNIDSIKYMIEKISYVDTKLSNRLVKRYRLNISDFPQLITNIQKNEIRWINRSGKSFVLGNYLSKENYKIKKYFVQDMIFVFRKEKNKYEKYKLYMAIKKYGEEYGVSEKFNIDEKELEDIRDEYKIQKEKFYNPEIKDIYIIDTPQKIKSFSEYVFSLKDAFIGFDTEIAWKYDRLSIVQLIIEDKVYILDFYKYYDELYKIVSFIFKNLSFTKVGYAIENDILHFPENNNMVDLSKMTEHRKGLSGLSEKILGKPLDKEYQLCMWNDRPLSPEQIKYAATDVYVLIDIYKALSKSTLTE